MPYGSRTIVPLCPCFWAKNIPPEFADLMSGFRLCPAAARSLLRAQETHSKLPHYNRYETPRPGKRTKLTYSSKLKPALQRAPGPLCSRKSRHSDASSLDLHIPPLLYQSQKTKPSLEKEETENEDKFVSYGEHHPGERSLHIFSKRGRVPVNKGLPVELVIGKSAERQKLLLRIFTDLFGVFQKPPLYAKYRKIGSRSLFSTCLVRVAECIIEEQQRSKGPGCENKGDDISDLYSHLEDFFSAGPPGSGWRPLREVVRPQVIQLLSDAGVIGLQNADSLLDLCTLQDAEGEAQIIHDSVVNFVDDQAVSVLSSQGDGSKPSKNYFSPSRLLEHPAVQPGQPRYDYRRMAQFLEDNRYVKRKMSLR